MLTKKLNEVSLSGIIANNAVFFSPKVESSISSVQVIPARLSKLNFSKRDWRVTCIDFKVLADPLW